MGSTATNGVSKLYFFYFCDYEMWKTLNFFLRCEANGRTGKIKQFIGKVVPDITYLGIFYEFQFGITIHFLSCFCNTFVAKDFSKVNCSMISKYSTPL